jgi:hypothetical protein
MLPPSHRKTSRGAANDRLRDGIYVPKLTFAQAFDYSDGDTVEPNTLS